MEEYQLTQHWLNLIKEVSLVNNAVTTAANWTSLEILSAISGLVASQSEGFRGMNAEKWLQYFIRELDVKANYEICLPEIKYLNEKDNYLRTKLISQKIPFCASTIKAEWDVNLRKYLERQEACLGTLHADLGNKKKDFYIEFADNSAKNRVPIIGECKYRSKHAGIPEINSVIRKMMDEKAPINIIVTNMLRREINLEMIERSLNGFKLYWLFNNTSNNQIEISLIYESPKCDDDKVFLLIESEQEGNFEQIENIN